MSDLWNIIICSQISHTNFSLILFISHTNFKLETKLQLGFLVLAATRLNAN